MSNSTGQDRKFEHSPFKSFFDSEAEGEGRPIDPLGNSLPGQERDVIKKDSKKPHIHGSGSSESAPEPEAKRPKVDMEKVDALLAKLAELGGEQRVGRLQQILRDDFGRNTRESRPDALEKMIRAQTRSLDPEELKRRSPNFYERIYGTGEVQSLAEPEIANHPTEVAEQVAGEASVAASAAEEAPTKKRRATKKELDKERADIITQLKTVRVKGWEELDQKNLKELRAIWQRRAIRKQREIEDFVESVRDIPARNREEIADSDEVKDLKDSTELPRRGKGKTYGNQITDLTNKVFGNGRTSIVDRLRAADDLIAEYQERLERSSEHSYYLGQKDKDPRNWRESTSRAREINEKLAKVMARKREILASVTNRDTMVAYDDAVKQDAASREKEALRLGNIYRANQPRVEFHPKPNETDKRIETEAEEKFVTEVKRGDKLNIEGQKETQVVEESETLKNLNRLQELLAVARRRLVSGDLAKTTELVETMMGLAERVEDRVTTEEEQSQYEKIVKDMLAFIEVYKTAKSRAEETKPATAPVRKLEVVSAPAADDEPEETEDAPVRTKSNFDQGLRNYAWPKLEGQGAGDEDASASPEASVGVDDEVVQNKPEADKESLEKELRVMAEEEWDKRMAAELQDLGMSEDEKAEYVSTKYFIRKREEAVNEMFRDLIDEFKS